VAGRSIQGRPAWRYINYWNARIAAANASTIYGPGVHLLTAFEWASLAMLAHKNSLLPHGNNRNTNPPSSSENASETAALDLACNARNAGWYANLTGTGPATWNLLSDPNGVSDLNGNMWEWTMGLHMQTLDEAGHAGHAMVLATNQVSLARSPYGKSTSVGATTLTDTLKQWLVNEFTAGGAVGAACYLIDSAGTRFTVASNTANTITVTSGNPAAGPYEIVVDTGTDITAGMTSGQRFLTLRNTDAWLKAFALPATADGSGAAALGNDVYYFDTADPGSAPNAIRTAFRGGSWHDGSNAGVFALSLSDAPSNTYNAVGFRLGKSL
jgi:formylglycine-generating enzyme